MTRSRSLPYLERSPLRETNPASIPQQLPDHLTWLVRSHHRTHYGSAGGVGACDLVDVRLVDAADRDDGDVDGAGDFIEAIGADVFAADILRAGAEDGAAADVRCAVALELACFGRIVGRAADEERRRCNATGGSERDVVGADVDAVGAGRECDVETVVDEQECVCGACERQQRPRSLGELACGRLLVAQLYCWRAGRERGADDVDDTARCCQLPV